MDALGFYIPINKDDFDLYPMNDMHNTAAVMSFLNDYVPRLLSMVPQNDINQ